MNQLTPRQALDKQAKDYGIFYWDTFDNETFWIAEADTLKQADKWIRANYEVADNGGDRVEIVLKLSGDIVKRYNVK